MLKEIASYMFIKGIPPKDWRGTWKYEYNGDNLKKEDTYVAILTGTHGDKQLNLLKESGKVNILYEAEKAVNKVGGHGTLPRNRVVVFELK